MWLVDPTWKEGVESKWNFYSGGPPSFSLMKKLQPCANGLTRWHRENYGAIDYELRNIEEQLAVLAYMEH